MRNSIFPKTISALALLASIFLLVNTSWAAVDYFLQIDGIDGAATGYHKTVHYTGRKLETGALKPGTYKITVLDQTSKPIAKNKHTGSIDILSFSHGVSQPSKINTSSSGGGISTTTTTTTSNGAMTRAPFHIHKEIDAASPIMFSISPKDVDKNGTTDLAITLMLN